MKRNNLFIALLLLSSSTFASTNVPNSITGDTQWNADGNPYILQGRAVVAKGATLRIGPNVKVVFQGAAALEVDGTLDVAGSAAAPAVFDMTQGGLQSELFLNGADADISSAKFLSGVFLVQDSNLHLQWFEITKGSGLYLRGGGTASVKNGKIYGNATGIVLDGKMNAAFRFDTITQNTYGLYLKGYSDLQFKNNSVHDNDKDVVNSTAALDLGGNYWGTTDEKTAAAKMQGKVNLGPMVSLKDLLRVYIQTQLPEITQEMSVALAKKEKKEARELAQQQKVLKEAPQTAQAPAASETTAPLPSEIPPAPTAAENTAEAASPATPEAPEASAPAPVEETGAVKTVQVKSLPAAPHKLEPIANLPPDMGNVAEMPAATPPATDLTTPPSATNEASSTTPPASPDLTLPPTGTASENTPPIPPEVSGSSTTPPVPSTDSTSPPPASPTDNNSNASAPPPAPPVPPAADTIAPPDITTSTAPPSTTANPPSPETVPAPPELNEQVPSTASTSPAPAAESTAPPPAPEPASQPAAATVVAPPPAPPAPAANANPSQSLTPPAMDSPALQLNANPTQNQQNAVNSLGGVSGDIDGMQPPPLDIDVQKSSNGVTGTAQTSDGAATQKPNDSGVVLPPIKDSDVAPPKDLDLPPTDDLGNINLDSKNK